MQKINEFLKDYYVNSGLYGNPVPIKEQLPGSVKCCFYMDYCSGPVDYSVVMPVHNKESIIRQNLAALNECIKGTYEIILILDSCTDNSSAMVLDYFRGLTGPIGLVRVIVIESDVPLFETVCDNIGFRLGQGKWLLEIKADMKMTEPGFNLRLTTPFQFYDNVIAVSGLCPAIERPILDKNLFYVDEVCNRGPLLLDAAKAKGIGYLDEMNYYLDNSEIDMILRARELRGWICGYVLIDFDAPLVDGTTRKNAVNDYIMNIRRQRCGDGFASIVRARQQEQMRAYTLPLT